MDAEFWHDKWEKLEIGFHQDAAHDMLAAHFKELALPKESRVFVPLCGKTLDIAWLLSQGYRVAGAELSEIAIRQLFEELEVTPAISEVGDLVLYSADGIDIFVGNIFDLSAGLLGPVDAIYDRAALVALPPEMRIKYTAHLREITNTAPQLMISFDYDQSVQPGPPFSVPEGEIRRHYSAAYDISLVESTDVPGGLKGQAAASENCWLLR
ncbi:thiopurine S-methyltransferase [Emcibacter nanhaiensis]|uniref:Thiopurine S-methyltransferase n=1 Tax=Emcibacter nanhaiensis TaxID=1505037 RepID=A0A501PBG2_9PROT|nr:thiopurine S-methyltransferase [Emcibacter nanhaiensis]TPD57431.1 thiopurine S-methyltransferase [Emcibacter nanhaiensis]